MNRLATLPALLALVACGGAPFTVGDVKAESDAGHESASSSGGETGTMDSGAMDPDTGDEGDHRDASDASDAADSGADSIATDSGTPDSDAGTDAPDDAADSMAAETGPTCVTDLSNIGAGDFRIDLDVVTTGATSQALASQRASCAPYAGWALYTSPTGAVELETDDGQGADRVFTVGGTGVNDGSKHHVAAWRQAGTIYVRVDATPASVPAPDTNVLGTLPALTVGADACSIADGPLAGTITNLCITRL